MIPANDDAMSSIDLFMKSISEIIVKSKPVKSESATKKMIILNLLKLKNL